MLKAGLRDIDAKQHVGHEGVTFRGAAASAQSIAICSTSQGDPECKGCGRTFEEVQYWTEMSPGEKRSVWRRITVDGTSWRFNRYAERAAEDRSLSRAAADAQVPLGFAN